MHNENRNLRAKMQTCFDLDYPPEKLQIIVSLDAPTDGTDLLIKEYVPRGVRVLCSTPRCGKAVALNRGMAAATGDIILFTDARQTLDHNALRELVANFAEESVGAVSGELVLLDAEGQEASDSVGMYWRYEKVLRVMEGQIHSVPGMTGAIYAIRRELFQPLPPKTVLDDVVIPLRIVLNGKRAVFDPAARAYDRVSLSPELEFEKKRRTLMGNYQLLVEVPKLLAPWRNPIFVQFVSHKVGRLLIPYCLVAFFISNVLLLSGLYRLIFAGQVAFYIVAAAGCWMSHRQSHRAGSQAPALGAERKS
jgi:cellulose synthase/poly-beta-1,6-N-acetylglucosamine synthase-like glycosyltransferase